MSTDGDWHVSGVSLILPPFAGPDDPAIIVGQDLPVCMQASYTAAIFWRPPGSLAASGGAMWYFIAQRTAPFFGAGWQQVDHGFLLNDGVTCGYVVHHTVSANQVAGAATVFETWGQQGASNLTFAAPVELFLLSTVHFTVQTNIDWDGCVTQDVIDNTGFNSGSIPYTTAGGTLLGIAFRVPPSGRVLFHFNGKIANNAAGNGGFLSFQIREGSTLGAGTITYGPTDEDAMEVVNTAGNPDRQGVSFLFDFGVVGATYNVCMMHRVSGGLGTFDDRSIIVQPVF